MRWGRFRKETGKRDEKYSLGSHVFEIYEIVELEVCEAVGIEN